MKKYSVIAIALLVALLTVVVSAFAPVGDVIVPYATPVTDGVIHADEYPAEGRLTIDARNASANGWLGELPEENSIELYYAWDENNLYLAGQVTDPDFNYTTDAKGYNGDACQISLNLDHIFVTEDGNSRAIFYSWGLQEDGSIDVVRQESTNDEMIVNAGKGQQTADGWCFEIALSLDMLAEDASQKADTELSIRAGTSIGALFCYHDYNADGKLTNAYGTSATERVGWDPDAHGMNFIFAEKKASVTEAPVTDVSIADIPTAPATADIGVLAAGLLFAFSSGAVIAIKKR